MNNHHLISIDLAKNVFQVCVFNQHNKVLSNKKVTRAKLIPYVTSIQANRIIMEACYSSNYWGRTFQDLGYTVKLIPPHQVKPFVMGNKNDANDAVAIGEASLRPKATFVSVKTLDQQDIQSLDRIRTRLIKARTATANQLRGLLSEHGIVVEKKIKTLRNTVPDIIDNLNNTLTVVAREYIRDLYNELISYDQKVKKIEKKAESLLIHRHDYQQLQTIPGIGPSVARGIISAINSADQFKNGRQMAAWIGLTPKLYASGDTSRMCGISKRGNRALRKQMIHGARAVIRWCENKDDPLNLWLKKLLTMKHKCKVVVALANKLARIAWAVLAKKESYKADNLVQA